MLLRNTHRDAPRQAAVDAERTTGVHARAAGVEPGHTSWGLEEGDELVPGRTVLETLGGGTIAEALLV